MRVLYRASRISDEVPFVLEITTTSNNTSISLPHTIGYIYNAVVDWGDGSAQSIVTSSTQTPHVYTTMGTYRISITGIWEYFGIISSSLRSYLTKVISWGTATAFKSLAFSNYNKLTTLPNGPMPQYNNLTSLENLFYGTIITTIPNGIFDKNTQIVNFSQTFRECYSISSIPTDLFKFNTSVTSFAGVFYSCTNITTIPPDLFRYNTSCLDFRLALYYCYKSKLPSELFYRAGEQSNRFLNQSVLFDYFFWRPVNQGQQGVAPDLWNCDYGTGTPVKTGCYGGPGNSAASLSNYADIPAGWK